MFDLKKQILSFLSLNMIDSFHLKTPPLSGVKGFVVERFITLLCRTGPFLQWTQWHRMPKIYVFELNGYNLPMFAYYVSWRVKLNLSCFISETIFRGRLKSEIKSLTKTTTDLLLLSLGRIETKVAVSPIKLGPLGFRLLKKNPLQWVQDFEEEISLNEFD